jgi:hypothetical protein
VSVTPVTALRPTRGPGAGVAARPSCFRPGTAGPGASDRATGTVTGPVSESGTSAAAGRGCPAGAGPGSSSHGTVRYDNLNSLAAAELHCRGGNSDSDKLSRARDLRLHESSLPLSNRVELGKALAEG